MENSDARAKGDAAVSASNLSNVVSSKDEAQLAKYKRLLTMARSSLEANQASLARKDGEIEELQKSLKEASLISKAEKRRRGMGVLKSGSESQLLPRSILCRVEVDDYIWVLMEYDSQQLPDGSLQKVENSWSHFNSEAELNEYVTRLPGVPFSVPNRCLSGEESRSIEEEAQKTVNRVVEEFRRFKVKSEIARKQKDAEARQIILRSSNIAAGTSNAGKNSSSTLGSNIERALLNSTQAMRDTGFGQTTVEELQAMKTQLQSCEDNWKSQYEKVVKENEALHNRGGDTLMAAQWRGRYDDLLREKEDLVDKLRVFNIHLDSTSTGSGSGHSGTGYSGEHGAAVRGQNSNSNINSNSASELRAMALNSTPYSPGFNGFNGNGGNKGNKGNKGLVGGDLNMREGSGSRSGSGGGEGSFVGNIKAIKSIEQQFIELKDEYKDFKRRSNGLEQQRKGEVEELRRELAFADVGVTHRGGGAGHELLERSGSGSGSGSGSNGDAGSDVVSRADAYDEKKNVYIRQMVLQFLTCKESEVRVNIEAALVAIFRYGEDERKAIEERRVAEQADMASDALTTITSLFGGAS